MNAICKFRVDAVKLYAGDIREFELSAVCQDNSDTKIPENQQFCKYTPSGSVKMQVTNPAVFDLFVPGKYVYLNITEALDK